jgi:glycosyltransferase involved in cell wall biosynthesis/2-polyprenyl-3-methyl-5-hydroxy-6-metoxy-1,4-benzoquinol methylase
MVSISQNVKYDYQIDLAVENNSHTQLIRRIPEGVDVLELGCATGYMSVVLRDQLHCRVVGVEYEAAAARKAEAYCDEVIIADVEQLQWLKRLGERRFDVITCADIIEHLRDPTVVLRALIPYLKPSGKLLASVPNGAHTAIRLEVLEGRFTYEKTGLLDETHLHFYTHASLRGLLSRSGYAIDELTYTFQDVPDKIIRERLARISIEPSERLLNLLHSPEAIAFQFIAVASPASQEQIVEPYKELHDLPIRESLEYTRNLLAELDATRKTVQIRDKMVDDYHHHAQALQERVAAHEQTIQVQTQAIQNHTAHIERLSEALSGQSAELENLRVKLQSEHVRARDLEARNDRLTEDLQSHIQTLQKITNSLGWRLWNRLTLPRRAARRLLTYISFLLRKPRLGLRSIRQDLQILWRGGLAGLRQKWGDDQQATAAAIAYNRSYDRWVARFDHFDEVRLQRLREAVSEMIERPLISILMPVYDVSEAFLREALESVLAQVYPHWELCVVDDASPQPEVRQVLQEYADKDPRIKLKFRDRNGHISAASNDALGLAQGDYIALMDHDDRIPPQSLYFIVRAILSHPDTAILYTDEDKLSIEGRRVWPYFKCAYNPDLMLSHNLICHFGVYRLDLVQAVGGFREGFEGAQDYDLALRIIERIKPNQIQHIPRVLYHWRVLPASTASGAIAKPYALQAGIRAVSEHLERQDQPAEVEESPLIEGMLRVKYALPNPAPLASIIIPTRNGLKLVKQCVTSILECTTYPNYEILIVDNNSNDREALDYFKQLENAGTARILPYPDAFNFSRINNFAVKHAKGELLVLMNNDIEVITPDWLNEMASHALREGIGAVGARLWYPNDTLQHGGVVLGLGGVAGHAMKYLPRGQRGYFGRAVLIQNYSAVTAACMAVRKEVYTKAGGLNEDDLTIAFNDVDFCLRLRELGYRNLWTPHAELYHHESATRGPEDTVEKQSRFLQECEYMQHRWGDLLINDPAYSPNLSRLTEDFTFNWHDPWPDRESDI